MNFDDIKTFEDACKVVNLKAEEIPDLSAMPERFRKRAIADFKLSIIAEALNEGWQPNWNDLDQYKYYPWFIINASSDNTAGSGLSCDDYVHTLTVTGVGSRLCYKTKELAKYAGEQFIDLYTDHQLY
jgi:hypothetical protein